MPSLKDHTGQQYWRSLNEYADTAEFREFMAREFSPSASELLAPSTRRDFLRVMGASLALAGLGLTSGCRWPVEKIAPFAHQPEGFVPGIPVSYATAMELGGHATGLLVTSYDGRPLKIEGNPLHPASLGKTRVLHQASILDLYDIDRSKYPVDRSSGSEKESDWTQFFIAANDAVSRAAGSLGGGLAFLLEPTSSPSMARLRKQILSSLPYAQWFEYSPLSMDNAREGSKLVFGLPHREHLDLKRAQIVAAFDSDFTINHPASIKYTQDFMPGRRGENFKMNRLYVVEGDYTATGSMADHRIPVRSSQIGLALGQLAAELGKAGVSLPPGATQLSGQFAGMQAGSEAAATFQALARDLAANRGKSVVIVGESQPPAVHALGVMINEALGNLGTTVSYSLETDTARRPYNQQIAELASAIDGGKIGTLVILGGNPAYNAPADLGFAEKLAKVDTTIHLSTHDDETSALCKWHAPRAHFLEAWGDALAWDGTYSVVQPLIAPLYEGLSDLELVARLTRQPVTSGYEIVRATHAASYGAGNAEKSWQRALHDGAQEGSAFAKVAPVPDYSGLGPELARLSGDSTPFELKITADYKVYDGRFANNGWMQECPDTMTKITWDNTLNISYGDAKDEGIEHGDVLSVSVGNATLELPAFIMPGQARGQLVARLGYGRERAGQVGDGVGSNTYKLLNSQGSLQSAATISKTGRKHELAETQDHFVIDAIGFKERQQRAPILLREANLSEYKSPGYHASHVVHHPELLSLWNEHQYTGHRWAMAIDLSVCNGCNACVVACQAENNIPVVGKLRVRQGREMHWIRVDRYFRGDPDNAKAVTQPLTCHQCENAPCEQVCPVGATAHTHEGLNDMVYNRCIGTRYCSNNCPYKVRRFNWFSFQRGFSETQKLQLNPEVTVRSRGVMEKCTYCVQRIQKAKIKARTEKREMRDGDVVTACQQACPSDAIMFGDLSDPNSQVSRWQDEELQRRSYALLSELNTKPRTRYLSRLRNPAEGTPEFDTPLYIPAGGGHEEQGEHSEDHPEIQDKKVIEINDGHAEVGEEGGH